MRFIRKKNIQNCTSILALTAFLVAVLPVNTLAKVVFQNEDVETAWELLQDAEPIEALQYIDKALDDPNLSDEDRLQAYVIQGRCLAMESRREDAIEAFLAVLDLQENYDPAIADWTTDQYELFKQAQIKAQELASPDASSEDSGKTPWYKKPITWVVAGVVIVVGVVLLSGGDETEDLPDFPNHPEIDDKQ